MAVRWRSMLPWRIFICSMGLAILLIVKMSFLRFSTVSFIPSLQYYVDLTGDPTAVSTPVDCDDGLDHLGVPERLKSSTSCVKCRQITCKDLLFGPVNDSTYKMLRDHMKANPYTTKTDVQMVDLVKDCDAFKSTRGYHLEPIDVEEAEYPLAFNILMHTNVDQVERLLRAIYRPQNVYCIHVDAKASASIHQAMAAIVQCFPNVFIATKLERVVYAGFSRLQADINCMQDMIKVPIKWKYLLNHAAQAFPLKTNSELVKVLKIYNGANDIEGKIGPAVQRFRFEIVWEEAFLKASKPLTQKTNKTNSPIPDNLEIIHGSAYGIFSRAFVEFVLRDQKAKRFLEWSRNTYSPDEIYWATLHQTYFNPHLKTPGGYSGFPNENPCLSVFAAWHISDVDNYYTCGGLWKRLTCVFGISDLQQLVQRREHFANKFYVYREPLAMDCLEAWIEHKVQCPPKFDYSYYQKLPFVHKND